MAKPKVLMVLSSCASMKLNGKDHPTGWYLPEFAHPYNALKGVAEIVVASPAGGEAPLDPSSVEQSKGDAESVEFLKTQEALWKKTEKLGDFAGKAGDFAAIFFVGGHGPMYDLVSDAASQQVTREFWEAGKVVSAVCHGPAALAQVKLSDGSFLLAGSQVTGFSSVEEDQLGFTASMPFNLEEVLNKNSGGNFVAADPWAEKVVVGRDGRLLTGQNPASASGLAKAVAQAIGA